MIVSFIDNTSKHFYHNLSDKTVSIEKTYGFKGWLIFDTIFSIEDLLLFYHHFPEKESWKIMLKNCGLIFWKNYISAKYCFEK